MPRRHPPVPSKPFAFEIQKVHRLPNARLVVLDGILQDGVVFAGASAVLRKMGAPNGKDGAQETREWPLTIRSIPIIRGVPIGVKKPKELTIALDSRSDAAREAAEGDWVVCEAASPISDTQAQSL